MKTKKQIEDKEKRTMKKIRSGFDGVGRTELIKIIKSNDIKFTLLKSWCIGTGVLSGLLLLAWWIK